MLQKTSDFFLKKLRLSDPWNYKAPILIAVPYFFIALGTLSIGEALAAVIASFVTILGIAGFGYFLNDLSDIAHDAKIGKQNVVGKLNRAKKWYLLLGFVAVAWLPWLYLPLTWLTAGLLIFQFVLFMLYSLPPIRLKERTWGGIWADAMYAHVNPAILAAITFILLIQQPLSNFYAYLILLALWQLFLGIRNILFHQISDYEADLASDTHTFATTYGKPFAKRLNRYFFLPAEVFCFVGLLVVISGFVSFFWVTYLVFVGYIFFRKKVLKKSELPQNLRQTAYDFLDDYYKEWMAVMLLIFAMVQVPVFVVLLVIHVLLFRNCLSMLANDLRAIGDNIR